MYCASFHHGRREALFREVPPSTPLPCKQTLLRAMASDKFSVLTLEREAL